MHVFKSWKLLIPGSVCVAAGLFTLFDSVSVVGASKVGLLALPLETIVILLLARIILHENLKKGQMIGVIIALGGFVIAIISGFGDSAQDGPFRWGDVEAIMSAVFLGIGIIFMTMLTRTNSILSVTGSTLFISGIILVIFMFVIRAPVPELPDMVTLSIFSLLPMLVSMTYVAGLARIGASLTSIIASFSILFTLLLQLAMLGLGLDVILPANIALAIAGGVLGISGIYLIHTKFSRV
jgi:drug/metabolite transporter (DMT)-like permease